MDLSRDLMPRMKTIKMAIQKARTSDNKKKSVGFPLVSKLGPIISLIR